MPSIGINIGTITVKVVSLDGDQIQARVVSHHGQPLQIIDELLREFPTCAFFGTSGHLGHISEVAAMQATLEHINGNFDTVASLGGENFAVYRLDGGRISGVVSHNKCAAGSGEFFVQQVSRLGLTLDEAMDRSFAGKHVLLATRCSVHCKSDITHKLNRHEAGLEDILRTLVDGMADKAVSLLEKTRRPVKRLLVIGGVAKNRAVIASLRSKMANTEVTVLPESPYFEALGAALLTRAAPHFDSPNLVRKHTFGSLPPLRRQSSQVTFISSSPPVSAAGPFVVGVDAGSTTTKAVLLDSDTCAVVASHYGRTCGDPVEAARESVRSLAGQVGNRLVSRVATTGSGREIIGAYFKTPHIYNEILAHAAGASQFDPEVDTIFEIGGQDSKYIFLRNGVPIDYAMNAACSAGTGSFLEECTQSDLALPLADIADAALSADAPVQFKTTCAAFINSDIRAALQESASRENVVAGLVYSVVRNYLEKVKGPRAVGRRVFLQGGVALNRAVAHAFGECLGKPIVVPPHPELLGAVGAALLAMKRARITAPEITDLDSMAAPAMAFVGQFTCRACDNCCTINRFEVAGRKYPFGGRCSLFENARTHGQRPEGLTDWIEARNKLILRSPRTSPLEPVRRIGVPRTLTVHSLYPLYSTFFSKLGFDVVLSEIDPAGYSKANAGFCFPAQIAHGAVQDLLNRGIDTIFIPHVTRMPNARAAMDSFVCPITQAGPYYLAKAFPGTNLLSPVLDFTAGYEACSALTDLAIRELGISPASAAEAYHEAVAAQVDTEQSLLRLVGHEALTAALESGKPAVILVGRSYNAFPPEASLSVARKLFSMGVSVIPGDCLQQDHAGRMVWHYPNTILNAAEYVRRHHNLFLVYVSNFSCTIDGFTCGALAAQMGDKPYLVLEIDAHTADAGLQTRIDAFLDVIGNYHSTKIDKRGFADAHAGSDGYVTTSDGDRLPLRDPRVRFYFPAFSHYHSKAFALAARWLGLNTGPIIELDRTQLERGLRYTSGRECLPFPICLGQMLEAHKQRAPDEIVGFYMASGGAPCVLPCYADHLRQFIQQHELENLFVFDPRRDNRYYGLSLRKLEQCLLPLVTLADLFIEMEQSLKVVNPSEGTSLIRQRWDAHVSTVHSLAALENNLDCLVRCLAEIPHTDLTQTPKVLVVGDFFTRFNPSLMEGVHERYTRHGIILMPAGLNELFLYAAYSGMVESSRDWASPPDSLRAATFSCLTGLRNDGLHYLTNRVEYRRLRRCEERYRELFHRTGLTFTSTTDMRSLFQRASEHISPNLFGEAVPTVGRGAAAGEEGFRGIIVIGPFNCLPFRISEAILKPLNIDSGMPILTYESDGFSVSPSFLREVDVHIEQVLGVVARPLPTR